MSHGLYVDLSLSLDDIRLSFRKSYRPLISKGLAIWTTDVVERVDSEVLEDFRRLHLKVAGRATRSGRSWELQREAVASGDAFLVTLRDKAGALVGGGLFLLSGSEALYAVGVYERDLFQMPLGHVVQYKAIETMKRLGLRWYFIGARPYPGDSPSPTEKEVQIGEFKEGFSTHCYPHFILEYLVRERPAPPESSE
jgi:FemAB family protein